MMIASYLPAMAVAPVCRRENVIVTERIPGGNAGKGTRIRPSAGGFRIPSGRQSESFTPPSPGSLDGGRVMPPQARAADVIEGLPPQAEEAGTAEVLPARYRAVRALTENLCAPLAAEDYVPQSM